MHRWSSSFDAGVFQKAEMLRISLDELILQVKTLQLQYSLWIAAQGKRGKNSGRLHGVPALSMLIACAANAPVLPAGKQLKQQFPPSFFDVGRFLAKALEPPEQLAIEEALRTLEDLGAIESVMRLEREAGGANSSRGGGGGSSGGEFSVVSGRITPLGFALGQLPISPRLGKMALWATLFRCLDPVSAVALAAMAALMSLSKH